MNASFPGIAGVPPAGGDNEAPNPDIIPTRHAWRSRGYLPHFDGTGLQQSITFHLADSLPRQAVTRMAAELATMPDDQRTAILRQRLQMMLDAGLGSCILRHAPFADLVQSAFLHGDGERYRLIAWVVMPNHVHVLIEPMPPWTLDRIIHSWKSFTAHAILKQLRVEAQQSDGQGDVPHQLWHREYWDRFIRDEAHFRNAISYLHQNPVKAGLVTREEEWRWSSAYEPASVTGEFSQ